MQPKTISNPKKVSTKPVSNKPGFFSHIKKNRNEIWAFLLFHLAVGLIIAYYYPYIDIISDTGGYIRWAIDTRYGGARPEGYSVFLKFLHEISETTSIVFVSQFVIYCVSQLFLYLSATYLFNITNRYIKALFLASLMLSFGTIYATNMAITEGLFTSFTTILVTLCIWFVYRQEVYIYIPIVLFLMLLIMLRYIALVYPTILFLVFTIAIKDKRLLVGATLFMLLLILGYVNKISSGTECDMGTRVFAAFGGWQKANNVLHVIPHIKRDKPMIDSDDPDVMLTDSIVRNTYPELKDKYPDAGQVCYNFIWQDTLPLKRTMFVKQDQTNIHYFPLWNYFGDKFNDFGNLMIRKYPVEFTKYYLFPNFIRTLFPEPEVYHSFQSTGSLGPFEKQWFHINEDKQIKPRVDILRPVLKNLSPFYSLLWLLFAVNIILCIVIRRRMKMDDTTPEVKVGYVLMSFVVVYFIALVYAAPVNLRFLLPLKPVIITQTALYVHVLFATALNKHTVTRKAPGGSIATA